MQVGDTGRIRKQLPKQLDAFGRRPRYASAFWASAPASPSATPALGRALRFNSSGRSWGVRILDRDPILRSSRSIRQIAALGDDAFQPHCAGVTKDHITVGDGKVLAQLDAFAGLA